MSPTSGVNVGIFDKAKDLLSEHNESIDSGIDKAAGLVNERMGGQHGEQIAGVSEQAKAKLDEFSGHPVPPEADPLAHEEPLAQPDPAQPTPTQPIPNERM